MYNTNYNLIVHYENDKYNIINFKGEKKLLEDYDEITIAYVYYEYYLIRKGNKYGVIDGKGNFIIPINYNFIEFEGYPDNAKIQLKKEDKIMEFKLEKIRKNYFSKGLMLNK